MADLSDEVSCLVRDFVAAIHEVARRELLEEMRAFAEQRQKREQRRAPKKKKAKRSKNVHRHTSSFSTSNKVTTREASLPGGPGPLGNGRAAGAGGESGGEEGAGGPVAAPRATPAPDEPGAPGRKKHAAGRRYSPEEIATRGFKVVVLRFDAKGAPRTALYLGSPKDGFHDVQLSQGAGYRFSGKVHRICSEEIVRDATDREAQLGFVS